MVKTAIVMILLKCSKEEAEEQLKKAGGFIRRAVK
jgi:N-acetylmuramic acid 6-phosphate etherase